MPRLIHPVAGMIALLTIAAFWVSTAISELFLSHAAIVAVKTAIPWALLLLIPALAAAGGSGFFLSRGQRTGLVGAKRRRMPFIAANGLLILIPAALVLASKARTGEFDTDFYLVQAVELIAGATNITLLGLEMRDGMKLTQWRRESFLRPAARYRASLIGKEKVANDTIAIRLKKPDGFTYAAGQAVYLTLPGQTEFDSKGRVRAFSLASAPNEPELLIATRMTDTAFKRCLALLPAGSPIDIEGPYGHLTLNGETTPVVFIAGGIGITPFRSMILDAACRGLKRNITLFYSNRGPADAAFLSELEQLALHETRFKLVAIPTDAAGWQCERGDITIEMIEQHVGDIGMQVFYIAGPPAMVTAMEAMLYAAGVKVASIRAEMFAGYGTRAQAPLKSASGTRKIFECQL